MLKKATLFMGVGFFGLGLLGFLSSLLPSSGSGSSLVLGMFSGDTTHVVIYLLTGLVGLWWVKSAEQTMTYMKAVGVVYAALTYIGVMQQKGLALNHFNASTSDNQLAFVVAVIALVLGFFDTKSK